MPYLLLFLGISKWFIRLYTEILYIHLCDGIMKIKHVLYYCYKNDTEYFVHNYYTCMFSKP
jgi:hypothetical protein